MKAKLLGRRVGRGPRSRALGIPALVVASVGLLALPACVSTGRYDQAVARIQSDKTRIEGLNSRIVDTERRRAKEVTDLQTALDQETALAQALRSQLENMGQDVDKLMVDRGKMAVSLEVTKARLAELRRAQAAAEARASLFHDVALKLKRMVDAGDIRVYLREGRMVIALPNDVLFDTAQTDIKPKGRDSLKQVAGVLRSLGDRHLQIAGHTDNVPIANARFPSNWELSTGRALEVTRFLLGQGLRPDVLSAAGYGEFDPVGTNDTLEGKARNRRIEITLVPNIDELVAWPAE